MTRSTTTTAVVLRRWPDETDRRLEFGELGQPQSPKLVLAEPRTGCSRAEVYRSLSRRRHSRPLNPPFLLPPEARRDRRVWDHHEV